MSAKKGRSQAAASSIYILSGGSGASGRQIVETALAQFPAFRSQVIVRDHVRTPEQAEAVILAAKADGGAVVHTFVDEALRKFFLRLGRKHGVATIDLMGPLLKQLAARSGGEPLGRPGLYRKTREEYFDRVEAIDFAVSHDDGSGRGILSADVVILGVSRCGKTPLCMYLAAHGWKAANLPVVKGIALPGDLSRVDRRRVVGLTISYKRLLEHRKRREKLLGDIGTTDYSNPSAVFEELEFANRIYRERRFPVIDVTDKPIEVLADEVIERISDAPEKGLRRPMPY
jgi:regulator of PEP synthase PpsR (kinase-PPPase family)